MGPADPVRITDLSSLTSFNDQRVRYYSGTVKYTRSFPYNETKEGSVRVILDLGNVLEMASVKINGHQISAKWCAPWHFDITGYVRDGVNLLEVDVVNMWPNRLIGDSKLPEDQRLTRTNIVKFNGPDADQYLRVSGLLGPVKLLLIPQKTLKIK